MNKRRLAASLMLVLATSASGQEEPAYDSWVGGFGELYNADSDRPVPGGNLDTGEGFGLEYGIRIQTRNGQPGWNGPICNIDKEGLFGQDQNGNRVGVDAMYFAKDDLFYVFHRH